MSHLESRDVHFIMGSQFYEIVVGKSNTFNRRLDRCPLFDWVKNELKNYDIQSIYMTYYEWAKHLRFSMFFFKMPCINVI